MKRTRRTVRFQATNPALFYLPQVVCCGPIRSSSTGTALHHGSTWQKSGLTGLPGLSSFWKRPTECPTRSLLRPSMRGTRIHIDRHNHTCFSYVSDLCTHIFVSFFASLLWKSISVSITNFGLDISTLRLPLNTRQNGNWIRWAELQEPVLRENSCLCVLALLTKARFSSWSQ